MVFAKRVKFNVVFIVPQSHPFGNGEKIKTGKTNWRKDV